MEEEIKRRPGRPPRAKENEVAPGGAHWPDPDPDQELVESDPALERVVVARGRTVIVPHPTKTKIVREGADGKPIRAPIGVEHGEGAEIMLDTALVHADGNGNYFSEAERLIRLGIVHRPGEQQMIPAALSEGSRVVEIGAPRGQQSPVNQAIRS